MLTAACLLIATTLLASLPTHAERTVGSGTTKPFGKATNTDGEVKTVNDMLGGQPIVEPFRKYFDKCAMKATNGGNTNASRGTCKFKDMGIDRDQNDGPPSCHKSGQAIDVGFVNCGGKKITPENDQKMYLNIVKCLATEADDQFKIIYRDLTPVPNMMPGREKGKHDDHMHVQLKTCSLSGQGKGTKTASRGP